MPESLDDIMERATVALGQMDYLTCEALCLEALDAARRRGDWPYYARILLPLQESRRQRRMIAADGVVRLGTTDLKSPLTARLEDLAPGCITVTEPHSADDVWELVKTARRQRRHVEVLFAPNPAHAETWTLTSFSGPDVSCRVKAPPRDWIDRWFKGGRPPQTTNAASMKAMKTPADWFLDACEALGDAALATVEPPTGQPARMEALERMLEVVTDHEILHQRLGDAARAMCGTR